MNDSSFTNLSPLTQLRRQMADCLSLAELQLLCFDLGINYDELPGAALSPKITGLLRVVGRDGRWSDLITTLSHTYRHTTWAAKVLETCVGPTCWIQWGFCGARQ
jgi:hypothetical protein